MSRTRLSTTVDSDLLHAARDALEPRNDAALVDAALAALLGQLRRVEVDQAYVAAYEDHPLEEPDDWGNLESFRRAAASS
jgi:hypothetical protein